MPELPDIEVYIERIGERTLGSTLVDIRLASPFLLRTVDPPLEEARGRRVAGLRRLGKRIVFELERDLFLVLHLMIAGRLRWVPSPDSRPLAPSGSPRPGTVRPASSGSSRPDPKVAFTDSSAAHGTVAGSPGESAGHDRPESNPSASRVRDWHRSAPREAGPHDEETRPRIPARIGLAAFDFSTGTLLLTEASKQRRASLHVVAGEEALRGLDPGGLEVPGSALAEFRARLLAENRTLKRALTDPRLFSGIGNAYSDEILHAARLSPVRLTRRLGEEEIERLHRSTVEVLQTWTERLRAESAGRFPGKVTAFREGMAVHGRYRKPCPVCGSPVQRIVYAANEANYCAKCQTGGRLLADRALSRLLGKDWPRTLEELEEIRPARPGSA